MTRKFTRAAALFLAALTALAAAPALARNPIAPDCGATPAPQCLLEAAFAESAKAWSPERRTEAMAAIGGAYAAIGRRDDAFKVFREALDSLGNPNDSRYVARALIAAGQFEAALEVVWSYPIATRIKDNLLWDLARAQALAGDLDYADNRVKDMEGVLGRCYAMIRVAKILIADGADIDTVWPRLTEALELSKQAPAGGQIVESVIAMLAKAGDLKRAEGLMPRLQDPRWIDEAAISIETARAKAGDLEAAVARAGKMNLPQNRVILLSDLAGVAAAAGNSARAKSLLREAHDRAAKIADTESRENALAGIAYSRAAAGDLDGALATIGTNDDPGFRDAVLDYLVKIRIAAGNLAGLDRVAPLIADTYTAQFAHITIANAYTEAGEEAQARRSLSAALKIIEDDAPGETRDWGYGDLAADWAKLGEFGKAAGLAGKIKGGDHQDEAWAAIAAARARPGEGAAAIEIAARIDLPYWRAMALKDIALALSEPDRSGPAPDPGRPLEDGFVGK